MSLCHPEKHPLIRRCICLINILASCVILLEGVRLFFRAFIAGFWSDYWAYGWLGFCYALSSTVCLSLVFFFFGFVGIRGECSHYHPLEIWCLAYKTYIGKACIYFVFLVLIFNPSYDDWDYGYDGYYFGRVILGPLLLLWAALLNFFAHWCLPGDCIYWW